MDVELLKKFKPDDFDESTYCGFVENLGDACYTRSILELWGHSSRKIKQLTKQDILNKFNRNLKQ